MNVRSSLLPAVLALAGSWSALATTATQTSCQAPATALVNTPLTVNVRVDPASGSQTGYAVVEEGGVVLGSAALTRIAGAWVAPVPVTFTSSGSHSLTCMYPGDVNYAPSTGAAIKVQVGISRPALTLTSSLNPAQAGQPVTFTSMIADVFGTPSGSISFRSGGTLLATLPITNLAIGSGAIFTTSALPPGKHAIDAVYAGDALFLPASSKALTEVINGAPVTVAIQAVSPISPLPGQPVAVMVQVSPASGTLAPTGTVTIEEGGVALGSGSVGAGGKTTVNLSGLAAGVHSLSATYGGDAFYLPTASATFPLAVVAANPVVAASSASGAAQVSPGSLISLYGSGLAGAVYLAQTLPLPNSLGPVAVTVQDSAGVLRQTPLVFVAPTQVNALLPDATATGEATITVLNSGASVATGSVMIQNLAPALFAADASGHGVAAALAVTVHADGTQTTAPVFSCAAGVCTAAPIGLGGSGDHVILELFGTGIRRAAPGTVHVLIGATDVTAAYAGPQNQFPGLDQVNAALPAGLAGSGAQSVTVKAGDLLSNSLTITLQ